MNNKYKDPCTCGLSADPNYRRTGYGKHIGDCPLAVVCEHCGHDQQAHAWPRKNTLGNPDTSCDLCSCDSFLWKSDICEHKSAYECRDNGCSPDLPSATESSMAGCKECGAYCAVCKGQHKQILSSHGSLGHHYINGIHHLSTDENINHCTCIRTTEPSKNDALINAGIELRNWVEFIAQNKEMREPLPIVPKPKKC